MRGCTMETFGTPFCNDETYDSFRRFNTYQCGDAVISQVYTQDGGNIIKIENLITGNSTTTFGRFGVCQ